MHQSPPVSPCGRRVYRLWLAPLVICALYALPIVWMGALALDVAPDTAPVPMNQRIVYGAIALPFLLLFVRTAVVGVYLGTRSLVIRNVLRSHRLRYEEVNEFRAGRGSNATSFGGSTAHLHDGQVVRIFALDPSMVAFGDARRIVSERITELNVRLTTRRDQWSYLS